MRPLIHNTIYLYLCSVMHSSYLFRHLLFIANKYNNNNYYYYKTIKFMINKYLIIVVGGMTLEI